VALASLIVFPDIASIHAAFPLIADDKLGQDLAYSAMLTKLPSGLMGLVLTSLMAAYMSTISTQLNWGSSYIVYDFYKKQVNPKASEKKLVAVGRLSTVVLMVLSAALALLAQNALQLFDILLVFGAGTGLIFILRWFWWRINAWSEITAMFASGIITIILKLTPVGPFFFDEMNGVFPEWVAYPFVVVITTILWLGATYMTQPETKSVLLNFYKKIQPGGPGWSHVAKVSNKNDLGHLKENLKWGVPAALKAMILGCMLIYSCMFAVGYWIFGENKLAIIFMCLFLVFGVLLTRIWNKIKNSVL
jgi:Na+/proline symporter